MGKKIKSVVKSVGNVATLGAIKGSEGGWLGGTKGVTNIFSLGTLGKGPIPNVLGINAKAADINFPGGTTGSEGDMATPTAVSDDTLEARDALRRRQLAAAGMGGTVLTGAGGLSGGAQTAGKSLLGS